jgi:hypothetical protein
MKTLPTAPQASRRALVIGLAAAATPMVPALANALSEAPASPDADAELLSLKPEFDDAFSEWVRQFTKDCLDHRELERLHLAKFGFERDGAPELDWDDPVYVAYDREFRHLIHEHHSGRSKDELELGHWDRLNDKINPLAGEILSYTASTLDGLRLQTRALLIYENEIWNPAHWDAAEPEGAMCDFFASLCGVLGVPFPPVSERWQA